eukprot:ANDGO_00125.mRNA.1 hypothetical protein H257_16331
MLSDVGISHRQVGVSRNGKLLKGTNSQTHKTTNSIPTKFETVLNLSDREHRGFSSSAQRFQESWEESPGPGSYESPYNAVSKPQESISKRGASGLAAKEKRWYELGFPTFNPPPPGAYYSEEGSSFVTKNRNPVSSAFARPLFEVSHEDNIRARQAKLPGPGSYDYSEYESITNRRHVPGSAAFRSGAERLVTPKTDGSPPGSFASASDHNLAAAASPFRAADQVTSTRRQLRERPINEVTAEELDRKKQRQNQNRSSDANGLSSWHGVDPSSPNRSPSLERQSKSQPSAIAPNGLREDGEYVPVQLRMPSAAFRSGTQREKEFMRNIPIENPGPGSYAAAVDGSGSSDADSDGKHKKLPRRPGLRVHVEHGSPAFEVTVDRFGRSMATVIRQSAEGSGPAPGDYYNPSEVPKKMISSSFFLSSIPKSGDDAPRKGKVVKVPGPAYYKPANNNKRSYHLNTGADWI